MNNKLFKRIVAAAASAVMLGSCAFATNLSNVGYVAGAGNVGTLSFTYNNGEADKVTYVAYAATKAAAGTDANAVEVNGTKYVLGEMVAINQFDNLAAATADKAETVPVDSTKLANADAIVLKSGDSKGSPVAIQAVALANEPVVTGYTVTFKSGNVDVASIKTSDDGTVTLPTEATLSKSSNFYEYKLYSWVAVDSDGNQVGDDILTSAGTYKPTADVTLYAKYKSTKPYGSITGGARLTARDIDAFKQGILSKNEVYKAKVQNPIYVIDK